MKMMLLVPFVLLVAFGQTLAKDQTKPPDIRSAYQCTGIAGNEKYTLPLAIEHKGDNYFLMWGGGQIGLGVRVGNVLSVSFVDRATRIVGVILYTIANGTLDGKWVVGDGKIYPEKCVPANSKEA